MNVLICILAHNNLPLTKRCLASALLQDYDDGTCGVLVIDNASTDSTPQYLHSVRGFSTILLSERLSVAACWNYVLEWAFAPSNVLHNRYAGVLMLNNDTEIREDCVAHLLRWPAPFVTGVSVRSESELKIGVAPTTSSPHPDFSCFMIKPECWKRVGRFDEGFEVAYVEDSDYHVRAHMLKVPMVSIDLPFVHHGSGTINGSDPKERRMIERAAERNRERFEELYGCRPGTEAYDEIFK